MNYPVFRLATPADIDQLAVLRFLMQKDVNGLVDQDGNAKYLDEVKAYLLRALLAGSYFSAVAEVEGSLVAANGAVLYEKPPSLTAQSGIVGYITNVYTRPEWRGRGIGTELMKLLVQEARVRGACKLHLGTTSAGKGVYERVGFKPPNYEALELRL
jgi:GNAT superfamily N-acetyltransferase